MASITDTSLTILVEQYLGDIKPPLKETAVQVAARAKRIKFEHDTLYKEFARRIDGLNSGDIDGGSASSIYLITQRIDGGNASSFT